MMPLFQLFLLILVGKYASGWLFGCSGFKCRGGRCIRDRYVCDGDNDCGNWDDEDNCRRCSRNAFYCKNRNCRSRSVVCNGRNECGNWADEDSCRVQVRLVPGPHSGRLEVKARGEWGTVCNDGFGYNDAKVVCTSLGLESTFAKVVKATRGLGRIWMDNVGCSGGESSLDQCSHNGWGIHNCDHWNDVGVTCHSSVPTRLSSWNSNAYYGRVEVYVKGSWGTVCRDMFGRSDAKVVCRSLGQPTVYVEVISVSSGIGPIWMDDVGCSGHEASLSACRHRGWGVENCGHYQDVGVKCLSRDPNLCMSSQYTCSYGHCISSSRRCNGYNNCGDWTDENYCYRCSGGAFNCGNRRCRPKSITCNGVNDCGNWRDEDLCDVPSRLVPGPREGRLEVKRRGEWGTVCSHSFTYQDAKVACRSLGYAVAYAQVVLNAGLGQGSGMIWLDDVECSGQESSVDKCSHRSWGNHNCHHGNDVGVRCPSFAPTRLVSGRVEVYRHGVWGTVCGDGFTHIEGKVVCRVLGLEPMYVEVVRKSRSRSQTTLLSDLDCFGNEASFDQCNKTWGSSSCDRHRQIGVKCNSYAPVRLLPGPSEGRLEVYRDGVWGTVCDANFTYSDAKVVCKYLGLKYDYAMSKENSFEQTSETVRLNNVSCDGHESSLSQCSHGGWAYKECKQSQVVAMVCYNSIPFRIVPGPREGRLEVYRRGQWGAVCADYFTYNIAKVICRSLGYQGEYAEVMTNLSANQMKIMVNRFSCSGLETSLGSCSLSLSSGNCGQRSAGVKCHSTEQHRLVPGPTEGRVHLYRGGSWGAVCDLSFTYKDARVVCTAINLPVDYAQVYNAGGPGTDSGTIWLSEVQCDGNETLLSECRHSNWGKGTCRNKQHLGAKCGSLSPVRLVPGPAAGRVEVYRQGVWGTVCQQNFTYINAKVVCQQLGLESAFAEVVNASKYGKGVKTWLSEVICSGNESSLSECKHAGWGEGNCSQDRDVGVVCHTSAPSRLVPGPRRGRLELYQAGAWGTVCSVGFSHLDARVACRGLGLTSAYAMVVSNSSKQTNRRALLANIGCSGQEEVLDVCAHDVWGGTYCNYPDVEIECPLYAPTRLVPGTRSGRVEVYRHGQWGTVCGDGFDHLEGQVVCRDLGLKVEYAEVKRDRRQIGTPLLTDLRCGGNESSLSSCLHKGWGPLACISNKTVQVTCHEDIPTRLVPGPLQGRLEVYKEGIWGTVCDNGFGTVDARVVCRALNLPMDFIRAVPNAGMSQGSGKVWMTYVGCSGNETALNRCSNSNWRTCGNSRDVGVMCHAVSVRMDNFFTYENVDTRLDCILQSTIAPPFEYTWSVGEVERSSGQTPYILWSFSKHDNSKRVFCQVNKDGYKVGDDNVDAVIFYPPPPVVFMSKKVIEGDDVTVGNPSDSNPPPYSYSVQNLQQGLNVTHLYHHHVIRNIPRSASGNYIVTLRNRMDVSQGVARDGYGVQVISINVLYHPRIQCKDKYIVYRGSDVKLSCLIDALPFPDTYTWSDLNYHRSLKVSRKDDNVEALIDNVQSHASGWYICETYNTMRTSSGKVRTGTGSCRTSLTVLYGPPLLEKRSVTVVEGDTVTLTFYVDCNPPVHRYRWKKSNSKSQYESSNSPPVLTNIRRSEAGDYIVNVINFMNVTEGVPREGHGVQIITVQVHYPPDVSCKNRYIVPVNESVNLTCIAQSDPVPTATMWSKESKNSTLQSGPEMYFQIKNVSMDDAGVYTCTVVNNMTGIDGYTKQGVGVCKTILTVLSSPPIATVTAFEGNNAFLSLPAPPNPVLYMYEWKKIGSDTFRRSYRPVVHNAKRSDTGKYIVRLRKRSAKTVIMKDIYHIQRRVMLVVLYAPDVVCPHTLTALENTSFSLTCQVDSSPTPDFITWTRGSSILQNSTQSQLVIHRAQRVGTAGRFTCTATNSMVDYRGMSRSGVASCDVMVYVQYPPPPLVFASISVFEGSNVTLSQPVSSNPQPYSYEWKLRDTLSDYRSSDEPPVLTNIQRTEAGTYMIWIRNKLRVTQGAHRDGQGVQFINMKVLYAPEVSCQERYLVLQNSSVNLTCQVDSFPRPNQVIWYRSGFNSTLKEGKALYLTVENIQVNQSGMYTCSISTVMQDSFGFKEFGNMSCIMSIAVVYPAPPRVTGFLSVYEGDNVTVSLPAHSAPPPHVYSWRKEGETTQFTDSPSPPTLNNISRSESGLYIIKLINNLNLTHEKPREGQGMQIVTVDVLFAPELTCTKDVYFLRGSTSALEAKVELNPGPSSVTWGRISKANLDTGFTPAATQPASLVADDTLDMDEGDNIPYLEEEDLIEVSTKSLLSAISTISMKTDSTTESGSGTSAQELLSSGEGSGDDTEEIKAAQRASGETGLQEVNGLVYSGGREFERSSKIELFQNIEGSADQLTYVKVDSVLSRVKRGAERMELRSDRLFTREDEFSGVELAQLSANDDIFSGHDASEVADVNIIDVNNKRTNSEKSETLENDFTISRKDESESGSFEIEHINGSSMYEDFDNLSETIKESSWHSQINATESGSGDELEQTHASGFSSYKQDTNRYLWTVEHSGEFSGSGLASGDVSDEGNSSIALEVANVTDTIMKPETVREGFVQYEKFYLTDIQSSDEGVYEFTASNTMVDYTGKERNETASCSINLHVLYPPPRLISASKSVFEGTDVPLSLPPDCLPLPSSYRWRKEDPGTTFITDINPPIISNISREDSGSYIIEVIIMMNVTHSGVREGRGFQQVTLTVLYGPEVNCMNYVVRRNSTVTLSCHIQAVPSPSSITWSRDDAIIHIGSNSLVMTNMHASDTGQYRCDVTSTLIDSMGRSESRSASCFSNVTVLIPPIPLRSGQLQVLEHEELPLSLPDPCLPAPHLYTWRRISPSAGPLHQTTSPPLLLHTRPADAGLYLIKLSNRMDVTHGESTEGHGVQFVTVKVLARPTIDCLNEYVIDAFSNVTMTCSVSHALNSSTLTWYRGLEFVGYQPSITITNATESHSGAYTCTVSTTLVDSWGRIKSWTSVCNTKLSLISGFKASVSPFGLLPPHLLPYIIYIGGSFLVLVFVVLLGTAATAGLRVKGSHAEKRDTRTLSSSSESLLHLEVADDEVPPAGLSL